MLGSLLPNHIMCAWPILITGTASIHGLTWPVYSPGALKTPPKACCISTPAAVHQAGQVPAVTHVPAAAAANSRKSMADKITMGGVSDVWARHRDYSSPRHLITHHPITHLLLNIDDQLLFIATGEAEVSVTAQQTNLLHPVSYNTPVLESLAADR
jgi:hypothetical protein